MIEFQGVDYTIRTARGEVRVLTEMTGVLPNGRYVLLTSDPPVRVALIDLLCGFREPQAGRIVKHGRVSWPIGRLAHFRSFLSGFETVEFFAEIYGLDPAMTIDFVREFCDLGPMLENKMVTWPGQASLKLSLGLALLPRFDVFVIDGSILAADPAFQRRWIRVFQERIAQATLIMATSQLNAIKWFCDYALIADHGRFFIAEDVLEALSHYPLKPIEEIAPLEAAEEGDDGGDFE